MQLGDLSLSSLRAGDIFSVTAKVKVFDAKVHLTSLWTQESFLLTDEDLQDGFWTIYGLQFLGVQDGIGMTSRTADFQGWPIAPLVASSFTTLAEFCCGLGGIAQGSKPVQGCALVSVDKTLLACSTVHSNGGLAVQGDVADPQVIRQVHQACHGFRVTVTAGFPCQPYSVMGQGLGLTDPRGQVLTSILQAAWRLQACAIVLECVAEVQHFQSTMELLNRFAHRAGYRLQEVVLDLQDQWVSRRRRWWGVLTPADMPPLLLPSWPLEAAQWPLWRVVPEWPIWPAAVEEALAWTDLELSKYLNEEYGKDLRVLDMQHKAPTMVHSYGCALTGCPCGCRSTGFSEHRLREAGLRGFGIVSQVTGRRRFLHVREAALLNALDPTMQFPDAPRAGLCLVGQLSSPLQSLWIFAHLRKWTEECFHMEVSTDPLGLLRDFQNRLLHLRADSWLLPSMFEPRCVFVRLGTETVPVQVRQVLTVGVLFDRHFPLASPGFKLQLWQAQRQLSACAFLHSNQPETPYKLCVHAKRQALGPEALSQVQVTLLTEDGLVQATVPAGTRLGTLLLSQGIAPRTVLEIASRSILPATHVIGQDVVLDVRPTLAAQGVQNAVDDAVLWATLKCMTADFDTPLQLLHPAVCTWLLSLPSPSFFTPQQGTCLQSDRLLAIFQAHCHWTCLAIVPQPGGELHAVVYDGIPGRNIDAAKRLADMLGMLLGKQISIIRECTCVQQHEDHACGVIALQHAGFALRGTLEGVDRWIAEALGQALPIPPREVAYGGLSDEQSQQLHALLQEHGVPVDRVADRVSQAVAKLGAGPVAAALKATNSWQALKAAGSRPASQFRWVHADELANHIEHKASDKFGTSVRKAKNRRQPGSRKATVTPLQVDPARLLIAPGTFTDNDQHALSQLAFSEVASQARGVAFCSVMQAVPFLQSNKVVSLDPLALVTTAILPADTQTCLTVTEIRFPAIYEPTAEAILLQGSLIQLGDEPVRFATTDISELPGPDLIVCRLSLYRDETTLAWDAVVSAPLRELIKHVPGLSLCRDPACNQGCGRFHPSLEENVDRLFLDVWGRAFHKLQGGRTTPQDAGVFHCLVRVPSSALAHLHKLNVSGFYVEPRSADGMMPHAAFAVVWLNSTSLAAATHTLRMCPKAVGLARLGSKYGIRVKDPDEEAVFSQLKPDQIFLKVKVTKRFRLFPLPHGFQRRQVIQALKGWNWNAKPLQPSKGGAEGCAWDVGSDVDPPAQALSIGESYVLVTPLKAGTQQPTSVLPICASSKTRRRILDDDTQPAAMQEDDPWSGGRDPWSRPPPGLVPVAPFASQPTAAASKLDQLRSELAQDVQAMVHKSVSDFSSQASASTASGQAEQRIQRLEVGVEELKQQNSKFESWFQSFGTQVADAKSSIQEVQCVVALQQQDLVSVKAEVAKQAEAIHTSVQQAVGHMQTGLSEQLAVQHQAQFQQIEALLAKRQRSE